MFRLNVVPNFRVRLSSPEKVCTVRYPTDAEWAERQRNLKLLRTPIGRDKWLSEIPGQMTVDAALFRKIVLEESPEFDEDDAVEAIGILDSCQVISVSREQSHFRIYLEDAKESVNHLLRVPSLREKREYWKTAGRTISGRRTDETTMRLEPAAELHDKLLISAEGYAGPIPITHKHTAIREVLDQIAETAGSVEIDDPEPAGLGGSGA